MATITARFAGTCKKCGGSFSAGAQIEWNKGAGSTHVACPTKAPQPAAKTAAVPSVADAPFQAWEVSRHGKPVVAAGDTRRFEKRLPEVRAGVDGVVAEPGVYTVVSAGPWRYQNAEDNEDMGDMRGANWLGPVYLRRASAEEAEKDTAKRLAEAIPGICLAIAVWVDKAEDRWAHDAMAAAAAQPGWGRVEDGLCYLTEEERKAQEAAVDVWRGHRAEHGSWATTGSYVRTWTLPSGEKVWESWQYIYDWDQPRILVAPLALVERIQAAQAEARRKQDEERAIQDRIRAGEAPVIRERFLIELEKAAQGEVRGGVQIIEPLPGDWTELRDEIVALGDAAFAEPASGASPLATLLFTATGGRVGAEKPYRHGGSPRFIYGEWKKLAAGLAKQAAEAEARAAVVASGIDLAEASVPALDADGARLVSEASAEAKRWARPSRARRKPS